MSILRQNERYTSYGEHEYPWAFEAYRTIQDSHWKATEIPLGDDVVDYHSLPADEQAMIKNILRLFTQNDVEALSGYAKLLGLVKPLDIQMMLSSFINSEAIHIDAYSLLTDTLGFDETFYKEFFNIPVMERKIDYLEKAKVKKYDEYLAMGLDGFELDRRFRTDVLRMVAVYAAGLEGIELMAQFMLLLSYQQLGKFKGMSQINTYSVKDENMHCLNNSMLFLELKKENSDVYNQKLENDIIQAIVQIVEQEHAMIDYLFHNGTHPTITREQAKQFTEFMANRALTLLELPKQFSTTKNPVPFMDELLAATEFANFFEVTSTAYSKDAVKGDFKKLKDDKSAKFLKMKG